jgi:hypothetical protein
MNDLLYGKTMAKPKKRPSIPRTLELEADPREMGKAICQMPHKERSSV